jgi:hypothetical protein
MTRAFTSQASIGALVALGIAATAGGLSAQPLNLQPSKQGIAAAARSAPRATPLPPAPNRSHRMPQNRSAPLRPSRRVRRNPPGARRVRRR